MPLHSFLFIGLPPAPIAAGFFHVLFSHARHRSFNCTVNCLRTHVHTTTSTQPRGYSLAGEELPLDPYSLTQQRQSNRSTLWLPSLFSRLGWQRGCGPDTPGACNRNPCSCCPCPPPSRTPPWPPVPRCPLLPQQEEGKGGNSGGRGGGVSGSRRWIHPKRRPRGRAGVVE